MKEHGLKKIYRGGLHLHPFRRRSGGDFIGQIEQKQQRKPSGSFHDAWQRCKQAGQPQTGKYNQQDKASGNSGDMRQGAIEAKIGSRRSQHQIIRARGERRDTGKNDKSKQRGSIHYIGILASQNGLI